MRQVEKLCSGAGVTYHRWPGQIYFCKGERLALSWDMNALYDRAVEYENEYGRDLGNGWLLRHPIKKMKLFQVYCGKVPYRIEAANALTPYTKTEEEMKDDLKG